MNDNIGYQQFQKIEPKSYRTTSNIANYKSERDRYDTFSTWTKTFIDTRKLALYGFFLSKSPDIVECVFCRVRIGNWDLGDNVLREHLRWSPSCPLLNRLAIDNIPLDPLTFDAAIPKLSNNRTLRMPLERRASQLESSQDDETQQELSEVPLSSYINEIKSPDFRLITNRLASFKEWPKSMKQKPKALSDAGFFYCGKGDSVKCFSCGGGLRDWEEDDDPWEQHALHYENCHYLNEVKSARFISATKRKLENISNEASHEDDVSPTISSETETGDDNDLKMCQICFEEERCAIFFPCMHVIACVKCSYSCDKCPICRSNITSIKRIYFS
jgi:E3 ubiquitin-protein ligase XIAP